MARGMWKVMCLSILCIAPPCTNAEQKRSEEFDSVAADASDDRMDYIEVDDGGDKVVMSEDSVRSDGTHSQLGARGLSLLEQDERKLNRRRRRGNSGSNATKLDVASTRRRRRRRRKSGGPHVKACVDKEADDACSYTKKNGDAREGTCTVFETAPKLRCRPGSKPISPAPAPGPPPALWCPSSPKQHCRMGCSLGRDEKGAPRCDAGQCAMRQGTCCEFKCQFDPTAPIPDPRSGGKGQRDEREKPRPAGPAPAPGPPPASWCSSSPKQHCRMKCGIGRDRDGAPQCDAGKCAMRQGTCCEYRCQNPQAEIPDWVSGDDKDERNNDENTKPAGPGSAWCPLSPKKHCPMKCSIGRDRDGAPICGTGQCAMRQGNCCEFECQNPGATPDRRRKSGGEGSQNTKPVGPAPAPTPPSRPRPAPRPSPPRPAPRPAPAPAPAPGKKPSKAERKEKRAGKRAARAGKRAERKAGRR